MVRLRFYLILILMSALFTAYRGDQDGFILSVLLIPMAFYGAFYEKK